MEAEIMLHRIIKEELQKIEQDGKKLKFKSVRKRKLKACLLVLIGVLCILMFIVSIVCFVLAWKLFKETTEQTLAKLIKKMPNTPIDEIIRGDLIE